jgi:hypothetical protein
MLRVGFWPDAMRGPGKSPRCVGSSFDRAEVSLSQGGDGTSKRYGAFVMADKNATPV